MTSIEWTKNADGSEGKTWNCIVGCARVSTGCEACYAERMAYRLGQMGQKQYVGLTKKTDRGHIRWTGVARFVPEALGKPLTWKKPTRVFVNSMSDAFHEDITNEQIAAMFGVMAATPQHTYQLLTKRPKRMLEWFDWMAAQDTADRPPSPVYCGIESANYCADVDYLGLTGQWPMLNVHIGVSVENQVTANERIPLLFQVPAVIRFVSAEPLLGPVNLAEALYEARGLDWVICGGESGPGARACKTAWLQSIVDQCEDAGVPCFVKQLGSKPAGGLLDVGFVKDRKGGDMSEWPESLRVRQMP